MSATPKLDPIANLRDVSLSGHTRKSLRRLDRISASFGTGFTALIGPSGAGKTSALNILSGFEKPESGSVKLPTRVGWAPSDGALWPHLNAREHITAVAPNSPDLADELLSAFSLSECAHSKPTQLSEGERDRLAIARALANTRGSKDSITVLDEPLAHVESTKRRTY